MIHTEDLKKTVALVLCSAYVEGDKPLSLLLISDRPEAGKTEIVKRFSRMPKVEFATDITSYGIKRDFAARIKSGELHHIVIPEFLQPLLKGRASAQSFTMMLQAIMEDGVMGLHTGFLKASSLKPTDDIRTVGIIGCMPRPYFTRQLRYEWAKTGFLSRWLVVTYRYNSDTVDAIMDSIERGDYVEAPGPELLSEIERVRIEMPPDVARCCRELAEDIVREAREAGLAYGYREHKHIRSLVTAHVVYERFTLGTERTAATMEDFDEVARLGYLFNEQFNEVER